MSGGKKLHVLPDLEAISQRAASIFTELAGNLIASKGRFFAALPGGSTPKRLYALLGSEYSGKILWDRVELFWGDERCVPKGHEESNFKNAYDALLSKVPATVHRIKGELDPGEAAVEYENDLKLSFGESELKGGMPVFDLVILGMGKDGHTASLFPGSEPLREKERVAVPVYDAGLPRVTLTLPVINNAAHILFLVAGRSKAETLKHILQGGGERDDYPAGLVSPVNGDVTWLVDKEAAKDFTAARLK